MKVLVLNSGSSSVKYQLFAMPEEVVLCSGIIERIGQPDSIVKYKTQDFQLNTIEQINDHKQGLEFIVDILLNRGDYGCWS